MSTWVSDLTDRNYWMSASEAVDSAFSAARQPRGRFPRAQATPLLGYLSSRSPSDSAHIIAAFRKGLGEAGFVEGSTVAIESRFADSHLNRLPELAADLVRHQVNVVAATGGTSSVVAAIVPVPSQDSA
jgi:putative ABC transport system substrate-binding protein